MKNKLNVKIVVVLIAFFITIMSVGNFIFPKNNNEESIDGYKIIKQDRNEKYGGKGQQKVTDKDGYFTTFETCEPYKKVYIEYKQNGNASWANNSYWNNTMETDGCGITALSIILSGYGEIVTPESMRKEYYPKFEYSDVRKEFKRNYDILTSDFFEDVSNTSAQAITYHLSTNRPVLICVWNKFENRWTDSSHYMALLAFDGEDMVYVSNPNGGENDINSSGWYKIEEVIPFIAKVLYIDSYE